MSKHCTSGKAFGWDNIKGNVFSCFHFLLATDFTHAYDYN